MTRLPRLTGAQLVVALGRAGFVVIRTKGSHNFLRHFDGRSTVVPTHSGQILGPGLLTKILRDCELTVDQLVSLHGGHRVGEEHEDYVVELSDSAGPNPDKVPQERLPE